MDDDDDDDPGRVRSEHFFGGFNSANGTAKPQSKKEWIEDMIKSTKLDKVLVRAMQSFVSSLSSFCSV
jgi:hypothetical protein